MQQLEVSGRLSLDLLTLGYCLGYSLKKSSKILGLAASDQPCWLVTFFCSSSLCQVRVELYDVRRTKFVEAHTTALACIALSLDGKLLATASERGTLVRVFSTADGSKVQVSPDSSMPWAMKQAV